MTNQNDVWPGGKSAVMDVTYTQANAAGGAVVCEISPGGGNEFEVISYTVRCSGTNGIQINPEITTGAGTNNPGVWAVVNSAAGTQCNGPVYGTVSAANETSVALAWPMNAMISGSMALVIKQTGAGAQNDTFRVLLLIRVKGAAMPTVIHSNSTNPANVTATAGAESFTAV